MAYQPRRCHSLSRPPPLPPPPPVRVPIHSASKQKRGRGIQEGGMPMEVCCTRALCKRKSSPKMEYTKEQALAKGGLFGDASKSPKLFSLRPSTLGAFLLAFHSLLPLLEVSGKVTAERSQSRSSLPLRQGTKEGRREGTLISACFTNSERRGREIVLQGMRQRRREKKSSE